MGWERKLFAFDARLAGGGNPVFAGVDEAGRGPLAGPVVAAAVIFRRKPLKLPGLNDSKQISAELRERLFYQIIPHSFVGIGVISEEIIDRVNIFQATRLAMKRAVLALPQTPGVLLIDGNLKLDLPLSQMPIIDGDAQSARIAAASVIAKVFRDRCMRDFDKIYPGYGFARHKGYATEYHLKMLQLKGATVIHRKSFRPVAEVL